VCAQTMKKTQQAVQPITTENKLYSYSLNSTGRQPTAGHTLECTGTVIKVHCINTLHQKTIHAALESIKPNKKMYGIKLELC